MGASIVDFAEQTIDHKLNLLGNRWLSRMSGGFIVAPSGHGKSTLVMQMAICWACGKPCFGIRPPHPLRVFIAQAEDDNNDVVEMAGMIERLGLSSAQRELVRHNSHVEWLNDCSDKNFFAVLEQLLIQWPADLLIINPYTAYQSRDIQDTEANNEFLRLRLAALLKKFYLGCLNVHHTGKTQFQKKNQFAWFDWMYDMSGGAVLTNWARAVLCVVPTTTPGTYKFIAAKRFEKIGWEHREYFFSHSIEDGKFLWIPSSQEQIATSKLKDDVSSADLLLLIPLLEPISQEKLIEKAKLKLNIGRDRTKAYVKILLDDQAVALIKAKRSNGPPELFYLRKASASSQ